MPRSTPRWMMLDRFVFRREDQAEWPFPDVLAFLPAEPQDPSSTSLGKKFVIAFLPAEPPAISRLYVRWPGGTKPEDGNGTHLVAAHRDLVLFRLTSIQKLDEYPYLLHTQDHFICRASSFASSRRLYLKRLPVCTEPLVLPPRKEGKEETTMQRVFLPETVGLIRLLGINHDEEKFAVAQLAMVSQIPGRSMVQAEICVLRSSASAADDDGKWDVEKIPIQHRHAEYKDLYYWSTDAVIPFNDCICWVDYYRRGILFYKVFEQIPTISYLQLPMEAHPCSSSQCRLEMYRSVCVTQGMGRRGSTQKAPPEGNVLKFIEVSREDRALFGPLKQGTGFTITSHTLSNANMQWVEDVAITSTQLWDLNTAEVLPHDVLMFPLVDMVNPDVIHFLLSEAEAENEIKKVSVVTIDMTTRKVVSIVPYINGEKDLYGPDGDMISEKSHLLRSFISSNFLSF